EDVILALIHHFPPALSERLPLSWDWRKPAFQQWNALQNARKVPGSTPIAAAGAASAAGGKPAATPAPSSHASVAVQAEGSDIPIFTSNHLVTPAQLLMGGAGKFFSKALLVALLKNCPMSLRTADPRNRSLLHIAIEAQCSI